MHYKRFAPVLLALGLSASARAAAPLKLPTVNGYAVELPGVKSLTIPLEMPGVTVSALPTLPIVEGRMAVPALAPSVVALTPVVSAAARQDAPKPVALSALKPAPSAGDRFDLDWSLLDGTSGGKADKDGEEHSGELVPADPGPKPMPPAGAHAQLRDATAGRKPIRMAAEKLFDGRRETTREEALPHAKIF